MIRIGRKNDGGYVIPSSVLLNTSYLFSGGYGNDFSFEKHFLRLSKASRVVLYDFSITLPRLLIDFMSVCKSLILRRPHYPISFHLMNILTYCKLKITPNISLKHTKLSKFSDRGGVQTSDLETAFNLISVDEEKLFFCKLDIEGYEYELIDNIVLLANRISGCVIEFHDTFARRELFLRSLDLLNTTFTVVHTHVNNYGGLAADGQPVVYEVTFLNRRLISSLDSLFDSTDNLGIQDQPNDPESAEIQLIW